ncbi:hypothetical protein FHS27_003167 [Rhodopirellula rubra]|uniref:Uncharacterized protein n=1 Tax=Aporhodopirellula rubra TaxID=980271 RepID=A0A7W5DZE5_9BACT|nr:hypothetical protein [Aporhodopirellula rubra]
MTIDLSAIDVEPLRIAPSVHGLSEQNSVGFAATDDIIQRQKQTKCRRALDSLLPLFSLSYRALLSHWII